MKKVVKEVKEKVEEKQLSKITYEITAMNEVLKYLSSRPFVEVQALIASLQKGELS